MAYIILFALLTLWAVVVLWNKPLRTYAMVYFVGGLLAHIAQFVLSGVFHFYQYHSGLIADDFHDWRLMAFFVALGIDYLICVLYVRYCRRHPWLVALVFSALIGVLEVIFATIGAMLYPVGWHPLLSVVVAFPGFLVLWRMAIGAIPVPLWLNVGAMAFWAAQVPDILLHGAFWLFHYEMPFPLTPDPRVDSRIAALLYSAFIIAPVATALAFRCRQRAWLMVLLGAALFCAAEWILVMVGFLVYDRWSFSFAYLYYLWIVAAVYGYVGWLQRRREPPLWEPPV